MSQLDLLVWKHINLGESDVDIFRICGELELVWYEEGLRPPFSDLRPKLAEAIPECNITYWVRIQPFKDSDGDDPAEYWWDFDVIDVWKAD